MDTQQLLTLLFVAMAVSHLGWLAWKRARGGGDACSGCGGGCGKPTKSPVGRAAPQAVPLIALERRPGKVVPEKPEPDRR